MAAPVRPPAGEGPDAPDARPLYVISVAADLAGVHPQTLRAYERRGLIEPGRTRGGSRRYSEADLARLRRIAELTEAGVNLEGVRRILELEEEVAALRDRIAELERSARDAVSAVHRQYRRELVPLRQAVLLWRDANRIRKPEP